MPNPFNPHDYNLIIQFLTDNQAMPHKEAKIALDDLGVHCSSDYIYKLRRAGKVQYDLSKQYLTAAIEALHKEGNTITADYLQKVYPGLSRGYANGFALKYRGKPLKVYKKKIKPVSDEVKVKLSDNQTQVKTGILTKNAGVTVHRMF